MINFRTSFDPKFDIYLANICGKTIDNTDEILTAVEKIFTEEYQVALPDDKLANDLFKNFEDENTADNVVEYLEQASVSIEKGNINNLSFLKGFLLSHIHRLYLLAKYSTLFFKGRFKEYIDFKKRFIKYNSIDVESKVKKLSTILGKEIGVKRINNYLLVLEELPQKNVK